MYSEVKKLHLIEEIIKVKDHSILERIETLLFPSKPMEVSKIKNVSDFIGSIPKEDLDQMEKDIKEHCRQIIEDDWK